MIKDNFLVGLLLGNFVGLIFFLFSLYNCPLSINKTIAIADSLNIGKFLFDYQSLIGGLLAFCGAAGLVLLQIQSNRKKSLTILASTNLNIIAIIKYLKECMRAIHENQEIKPEFNIDNANILSSLIEYGDPEISAFVYSFISDLQIYNSRLECYFSVNKDNRIPKDNENISIDTIRMHIAALDLLVKARPRNISSHLELTDKDKLYNGVNQISSGNDFIYCREYLMKIIRERYPKEHHS